VKEVRKYQLTYFVRFIGDALFYPFFALYLKSMSVPNNQIGLILMILPLVALFVNPIWSSLSRNINDNRHIMRILTVLEAITVIVLIQLKQTEFIALAVVILAIVGQPVYVLLDSYTSVFSKKRSYPYGNIRLFGSFSYGVTTIIGGVMIAKLGYEETFILAAVFFALFAVALTWILPLDIEHDRDLNLKSDPKVLIHNTKFIQFAIFYVITLGILFGGDNFLSIYFESLGVSPDQYGLIMFIFIIFEMIVLAYLSANGYKYKTKTLLLLIVITNGLRFLVYGIDLPLIVYIGISLIRSVTMGTMLYVTIRYIEEIVLPKNITLGILIFSSFRSLFTALVTLSGGYITEFAGYRPYYLLAAIIALSAIGFIDYKKTNVS
jgi:MFS transporter, PPP family, 3-phenylpropionic acid transporter